MDKKSVGVLAVLGASLMWAVEPVFAKLSYINADFFETQLIRVGVITLIALAYGLISKGNFKPNKKKFTGIIYVAVAGTLIGDLIYFFALASVPAVNAVMLGHLQPIFVVLIGFLVLKEDVLSKFDYLGIFLMIISALMVTTRTIENLFLFNLGSLGDLLILTATFFWATSTIAMRKYLKEMNAGVVSFYRFSIAFLVFFFYLLFYSSIGFSNIFQFLLGLAGGIGIILFFESIKRLKAAQSSALELTAPLFAGVLAFFILYENITLMQLTGTLLVFFGVYFLSKKENKEKKT